jgi:hypothetical protein
LWILSANNSITGVTNYPFDDHVTVFPNPITENISLLFQLKNEQEVAMELIDITGKKVIGTTETFPAGTTTKLMFSNQLAAGIYLLKVTGQEFKYSQKIVKK